MNIRKGLSLFFALFCISALFSASPGVCETTANRCLKYRAQVVREARVHVGKDAPYHIFLGQIEQESRCRVGATAFDGGQGLGQFMPGTAKWLHGRESALQEISPKPAPYDPRWNIRAMILYDKLLYDTSPCAGWYFALRSYNGGAGTLNKEIRRAGSCDIAVVEEKCARKVITLKNGSKLDMCSVNIEYPYLVVEKGGKYK